MPAKTASKRVMRWERLKGPRAFSALLIATALGAGLSPFAPGTMGTLVGVPIVFLSANSSLIARLALWIGLLALGTWAAKSLDEIMGSEDNQSIVIDEVVGFGISAWTADGHLNTLIAAFVLFRLFDIWKPFPVRSIDRWSKKMASQKANPHASWYGGFGVMADDVAAGFQALLVVLLLQHFQLLP
jgi:phosphatidylglycerophosphatase A